ncbi:hypothetical protein DFH07DRAFT_730034 [Mycena maculata]|uniref:BTB domain-containing protein n=1 Tax=Mycena maculata TaxID=230809 RepID=A0AAD7K818_9AGAR|nr:hypothetical protein DFH07DRAFT_730034 [Mycena maculata]
MEVDDQPHSVKAATSPVHDERYYFSDGGVIFLCEGVLYKLHKSRLAMKSDFFRAMFEMPQGGRKEGHDNEHPIIMTENNMDFRNLLVFLYDQYVFLFENPSLQYYISILHLSRKYTIPSGVKYAVANLPTHRDFTPAIQLRLARQYSILHWADLGFQSLVFRRLKNITLADAETMGVVAYHKLVQVHCQIQKLDLDLAFNPPTVVHSPGCLDENVCSKLWDWAWWMGYAKQLLHLENVKSRDRILDTLDPSKGILSHMDELCLQNTLGAIREENPFNDDEEYVLEASSELKAWMEGL